MAESGRCYFCFGAPCAAACPTSIDIPLVIRKIGTGNVDNAIETIASANILGGMRPRLSRRNAVRGDLHGRRRRGQTCPYRPPTPPMYGHVPATYQPRGGCRWRRPGRPRLPPGVGAAGA
ncbi:hypothetical protein [Pleomorphomonas koreensis]|uniref:hypothetical protein n=1 Tax=Pleomorphomonas koreensis TaxID=257440 RepID=UPI001FE1A03B|nr:hypothetical protein [Pleomorphomonas koreensis]